MSVLTKASTPPLSHKRGLLWPRFFYIIRQTIYVPIKNIVTLLRIGRMSAGILHDLMSPITALICALELIDDTHPHATAIQTTRKNAEQAIAFIREQLDNQPKIKSRYNASDAINATLQLLQHRAHKHNVQVQSIFYGPKYIHGNKIHLYRVLMNLISNAIDAHSCHPQNSDNLVIVKTTSSPKALTVTISDNGCGMTESEQRNSFRSFYTKKETGVGVGLSVVKHIVKHELHGTIHCKSTKDVGTTFTLTIPLS